MKSESEFGRGFAVCLIQFVFHTPSLADDLALYARMRAKEPDLFQPIRAVEMWASGSVDHLYELVRPIKGITRVQWTEAKRIRSRMFAAKWGGRFRGDGPAMGEAEAWATISAAQTLLNAVAAQVGQEPPRTIEAAEALDAALGLTTIRGTWSCTAPMPSREFPPSPIIPETRTDE